MFKPSRNPQVAIITESYRERVYRVSNLPFIPGDRSCVWCGDPLKSSHHASRYCKDPNCQTSAYAWASPQKEEGLWFLLVRQDFKCLGCGHDYAPLIEDSIVGKFYGCKVKDFRGKFNHWIMKKLKELCPKEVKPEVDHRIPISKGGQSLGLENHSCVCYTCHKAKSKVDNSGPRVIDPVKKARNKLAKVAKAIKGQID